MPIFLLAPFCFSLALRAQAPAHSRPEFGRSWWTHLSNNEGHGFLSGYSDCTYAVKGAAAAGANISVRDLSRRISTYFANHKGSALSVPELADRIDHSVPHPHPMPGSEVYTNPHGYYDGLWWKGAVYGEQPAYVEGYLVCLGRPTGLKGAQKTADGITAWYKQHPSREDRAIAYVLEDVLKARK